VKAGRSLATNCPFGHKTILGEALRVLTGRIFRESSVIVQVPCRSASVTFLQPAKPEKQYAENQ